MNIQNIKDWISDNSFLHAWKDGDRSYSLESVVYEEDAIKAIDYLVIYYERKIDAIINTHID